jgi:hypothetical protein
MKDALPAFLKKEEKMSVTTGEWVDGKLINVRVLADDWIMHCPIMSFDPYHYKEDGTCLCFNKKHQDKIKQERLERRAKTLAAIKRQGR